MAEEKKGIPGSLLVVATFIGGIIGAVSGLLLAPQPGKKTREQLKESYDGGSRRQMSF